MANSDNLPIKQRRNDVMQHMPEKLREELPKFTELFRKNSRGTLIIAWELGNKLLQLEQDPAKYGATAVDQLGEYYGHSRGELYRLRDMAKVYSKEALEEMTATERQLGNGQYISVGHVIRLAQITKSQDRERVLKRIYADGLSTHDMDAEIKGQLETTASGRKTGGGRKARKPKSVTAALYDSTLETQRWNNRVAIWQESLFDTVDELSPDAIDPAMVEKFQKLNDQLTTLEVNVQQVHARTLKNLERIQGVIKSRISEQKATEVAEKAAKKATAKK